MNKTVKISEIKVNPNNPRLINDDKFKKLVQSVKDFPEMLNIRPIVVNQDMIILGGNMRFKACKEAGLKEVPIIITDLTKEQQKEFLIKDNTSGGEWDWDILANEWDAEDITKWGLDLPISMENILTNNFSDEEFINEFEKIKNENAATPIVANFNEKNELFLIPIDNEIDELFIREIFKLNETKQFNTIKGKSNIITIEDIKCLIQNLSK